MDIVKFINRYLPPTIELKNVDYQLLIFFNHPHYDTRVCYSAYNGEDFLYLVENIKNDFELVQALKHIRKQLQKDNLLTGDYATPEGYTLKKFRQSQTH